MALILIVRNSLGELIESSPPLRFEQGEVMIGRGEGVQVRLPSPTVSRTHCSISGEGTTWVINDSSSGGTYVNGRFVEPRQPLLHGDLIVAGDFEIEVALGQDPAIDRWEEARGQPKAENSLAWQGRGKAAISHGRSSREGSVNAGADATLAGQLLQAAGLSRQLVNASDNQIVHAFGMMLRAGIAGLVRLSRDRRKARADLGVAEEATETQELEAVETTEELLMRLLTLAPSEASAQVTDLTRQIDCHQEAVLVAMQDCFHRALDVFSPNAIKTSARGDAEAWRAYEKAYDAENGFVDLFASSLAKHYAQRVAQNAAADP